jgi:hypothetical protein
VAFFEAKDTLGALLALQMKALLNKISQIKSLHMLRLKEGT